MDKQQRINELIKRIKKYVEQKGKMQVKTRVTAGTRVIMQMIIKK